MSIENSVMKELVHEIKSLSTNFKTDIADMKTAVREIGVKAGDTANELALIKQEVRQGFKVIDGRGCVYGSDRATAIVRETEEGLSSMRDHVATEVGDVHRRVDRIDLIKYALGIFGGFATLITVVVLIIKFLSPTP